MASNPVTNMALFCDFENIALGVRDAKYEKFDIGKVLERLLLKGSIVVKKAYCDWERYKGYKAPMHEASFELIEIPHVRQSGKNSADIRMVVDALDLCYTKSHVETFVIISGDSDFSPLVSKLRENNKQVIGVGVKNSTSDLLIANCDEFIYYDDLVREGEKRRTARRKPAAKPVADGRATSGEAKGTPSAGRAAAGEAKAASTEPAGVATEAGSEGAETRPASKIVANEGKATRGRGRGRKKAAATAVEEVPATAETPVTERGAQESIPVEPASVERHAESEPADPAQAEPVTAAEVPPDGPVVAKSRKGDGERRQEGLDLIIETVEALIGERGEGEKVWGSMVKQALKRRKPGFSESYYGFRSFNGMLEDAQRDGLLALESDEKSGGYVVRLTPEGGAG